MTISTEEIVEACKLIASQSDLKVCVKEALKGAGLTGLGALTLGLAFGPMGIALGLKLFFILCLCHTLLLIIIVIFYNSMY